MTRRNVHLVDTETGELVGQGPSSPVNRVRSRSWRERTPTDLGTEPSKTKQAFRDEVDINRIMERFNATGQMPPMRPQGRFGDFTGATDYLEAATRVLDARRSFDELPSDIRDYCDNDPAELIDLMHNPERLEEAQDLGLIQEVTPQGGGSPPGPVDDKREGVQSAPELTKSGGKDHAPQTPQPRSKPTPIPAGGSGTQAEPA